MYKKIVLGLVILTISTGFLASFKKIEHRSYANYSTKGLSLNYSVSNKPKSTKYHIVFSPKLGKSYDGFKEAVAFRESSGDYKVINKLGYLGRYQFGKETLRLIGIYNLNRFLNTPEVQDKAFYANLSRNKWILRRDLKWFTGKTIKGIKITESGMLAAAHLGGPGSVKKFLRSGGNKVTSDAFGTSIAKYMKIFGGYDTTFVVPNKRAKAKYIRRR